MARYYVIGAIGFLIICWVAASNIGDPQNSAKAYQIQLQAQAKATQQAIENERQAAEDAQWAKERAAISAKLIDFMGRTLDAISTAIVVLIVCGTVAGGVFAAYTVLAYKKFADIRVSIIKPDQNGRLPALVRVNKGHYQLLDGATGQVVSTFAADFRSPAQVEALKTLMLMYMANVTTKNAAQAKLPQGVRASFPEYKQITEIIDAEA